MPELPEVETIRRVLQERLKGLTLTSYEIGTPTFYRPPPAAALDGLVGRAVEGVRRRGKYLILDLSGGGELVLHLGMSGRLVLGARGPHTRLQLRLGPQTLSFHDARRFGRAGCGLPELGPEPLDPGFTARYLSGILRGRRAPVKALLMDQRLVAGIGNIYATEALYRAGIRPARAAGGLTAAEVARLRDAVRAVLARAIKLGGSTLEDEAYLDPLNRPGRFQASVAVYGREACPKAHPLKAARRLLAGRTSLYCPVCQR